MENLEKIEMNSIIRKYNGNNSFILSLQKYLKNTKDFFELQVNGKTKKHKQLSDKQYKAAKETLDSISI